MLFYKIRMPLPQNEPSLQYRNQGSFQHHHPSPWNLNPIKCNGLIGIGLKNQSPPLAKSSAIRLLVVINQQNAKTKFAVRLSHLGVLPLRGILG